MQNIEINETPVRTSRNFNINNIKLENIEIPATVGQFKNISIEEKENIANDVSKAELKYGIGEYFTNKVNSEANQKIKLEFEGKSKNQIEFKFNNENDTLLENIEIVAKENSKATLIIKYKSEDESYNFHNGIIRVSAKKNAAIDVIIVNYINEKSNNFLSIENVCEENAQVNYTMIEFGGKNTIVNYYSNIRGENSKNNLDTIYFGKQNQLFDFNYIGELTGKKTKINIEVQGALTDNAKKHFKGTINFKKGCKKAKGNENEACMLLSDTAKSLALPMLLCSEEDVEGNHSSSAGKIGQKELFYIMSRGFELKEAMKLMVKARFNEILQKLADDDLKEEIFGKIDELL